MYLTVINKYTKLPVSFFIEEDGEIKITSSDPRDNDETCIVTLTKTFHEKSHFVKVKDNVE